MSTAKQIELERQQDEGPGTPVPRPGKPDFSQPAASGFDLPATMTLPPTVSLPALLESGTFGTKLQVEQQAAEQEIGKIDVQLEALERRKTDLLRIVAMAKAGLAVALPVEGEQE